MTPFAAFTLALVALGAAQAETWPLKPLRLVVAAPAGSSLDVLARTIGDRLGDRLGAKVIVDDRPATGFVAKASPDGLALVMSFNGPLAFGPYLYAQLPYVPLTDLAPVIITSS